eukprot:733783-Pelagomonas_calceolata.AAC.4
MDQQRQYGPQAAAHKLGFIQPNDFHHQKHLPDFRENTCALWPNIPADGLIIDHAKPVCLLEWLSGKLFNWFRV